MNKILFVSAVKWELDVVQKLYKNQPSNFLKADFLVIGIWGEHAKKSLMEKLSKSKYDFIINIWVCGYRDVPYNCIQIVRSFNKEIEKEIMVPIFFEHAPLVSILCSENPIYKLENEPYADMESYMVEQICEMHKIWRIILKIPVDKVGEETKNFNKRKALKKLEQHVDMPRLVSQILQHLQSLPKQYDIQQYSSHYRLTFSENIIFERYFHKYTSILQKDFWIFFIEYKHLSKKDFLKLLASTLDNYSLS